MRFDPEKKAEIAKFVSDWTTDDRFYLKVERKCKICNSPDRGLVEDLYFKMNVGYRTIAKEMEQKNHNFHFTSIERHLKHHTRMQELERVVAQHPEVIDKHLTAVRLMTDTEKLDMISDRGLVLVHCGAVVPTVKDSLDAIKTKYAALQSAGSAELSHALAKKIMERQQLGEKKQKRLERTSSLKNSG